MGINAHDRRREHMRLTRLEAARAALIDLRAAACEMQQDARRLDWLEEASEAKNVTLAALVPNSDTPVHWVHDDAHGEHDGYSLRDAIDNAMRSTPDTRSLESPP